jgi:hypothetical protein
MDGNPSCVGPEIPRWTLDLAPPKTQDHTHIHLHSRKPLQFVVERHRREGWVVGHSICGKGIEAVTVGILSQQAYQGGTWGRWLWWGSPDLELEGMRKDTGHKIYTGSGRQGGELYVLFGGSSMVPCAWCWVVQISS